MQRVKETEEDRAVRMSARRANQKARARKADLWTTARPNFMNHDDPKLDRVNRIIATRRRIRKASEMHIRFGPKPFIHPAMLRG